MLCNIWRLVLFAWIISSLYIFTIGSVVLCIKPDVVSCFWWRPHSRREMALLLVLDCKLTAWEMCLACGGTARPKVARLSENLNKQQMKKKMSLQKWCPVEGDETFTEQSRLSEEEETALTSVHWAQSVKSHIHCRWTHRMMWNLFFAVVIFLFVAYSYLLSYSLSFSMHLSLPLFITPIG